MASRVRKAVMLAAGIDVSPSRWAVRPMGLRALGIGEAVREAGIHGSPRSGIGVRGGGKAVDQHDRESTPTARGCARFGCLMLLLLGVCTVVMRPGDDDRAAERLVADTSGHSAPRHRNPGDSVTSGVGVSIAVPVAAHEERATSPANTIGCPPVSHP